MDLSCTLNSTFWTVSFRLFTEHLGIRQCQPYIILKTRVVVHAAWFTQPLPGCVFMFFVNPWSMIFMKNSVNRTLKKETALSTVKLCWDWKNSASFGLLTVRVLLPARYQAEPHAHGGGLHSPSAKPCQRNRRASFDTPSWRNLLVLQNAPSITDDFAPPLNESDMHHPVSA